MTLENQKSLLNHFNFDNKSTHTISNQNISSNPTSNVFMKGNDNNLFKRKIIKIKEKNKVSMTSSNFQNNSSSLINNTISHTNQSNYSNSNNISNYLPNNNNYLSKVKNKISLESSINKNKYINNINNTNNNSINLTQKRSSSAVEEPIKHNNYLYQHNNATKAFKSHIHSTCNSNTNIYNKYIASSNTKQHSSIKTHFSQGQGIHNSQNLSNNQYANNFINKPNHIKNSSLFSGTIASFSKPKHTSANSNSNSSQHIHSSSNSKNHSTAISTSITTKPINKYYFGIKPMSKTSYPTKTNSRKHSIDKERKNSAKVGAKADSGSNSNSNSNSKIKTSKNNSSKQVSTVHNKGYSELPMGLGGFMYHINEQRNSGGNVEGRGNSKVNAEQDIEFLISKCQKKNNYVGTANNGNVGVNLQKGIKMGGNIITTTTGNNKITNINNNINVNINLNINGPNLCDNNINNNAVNNNQSSVNHNNSNTNKKEKGSQMQNPPSSLTSPQTHQDKPPKTPDGDLDTDENRKDEFLRYLNLNIDNPSTNTLNDSFDSVHSTIHNNKRIFHIDMGIISNYIQQYHQKYKKYPTTKLKFYKYGRLLGKGAFGKVNLSLHVLTGRLVAIKSINKSHLTSEHQKKKMEVETSIMKALSHSNYVVKIFETYETQKHVCIVMEYICAGDLLSYIRKRSKLTEAVAKYIFKQIILGLQYIHSKGVVHRDIKLDNILIDLDNKIKICDFGVSKRIRQGDIMVEQCGTPAYIAPEILKNKGYKGFGVDIWSAGVVLYAMLSGNVPFKANNVNDLHNLIMTGKYPEVTGISNVAQHLLENLLMVDPEKRITIKKILQHPWLFDVDVDLDYNLFTNAERVLLVKSNIDYRDAGNINKDDNLERFSVGNIDTSDEIHSKNNNSKSIILAPFNSSLSEDINDDFEIDDEYSGSNIDGNDSYFNLYGGNKPKSIYNSKSIKKDLCDIFNAEIKREDNIIKFKSTVKELNRLYELNNNGEIDNGVVISHEGSLQQQQYDENNNNNYANKETSPYIKSGIHSKPISKPFSPFGELDEAYVKNDANACGGNSVLYEKSARINDEQALNEMTQLGYSRQFIINSLDKNEVNYATAGYYLLVKYNGKKAFAYEN